MDDRRFGVIFRILYIAGTVILAVLGWSLKTQYDAQASTIAHLEQTQQQVQTSSHEVERVVKQTAQQGGN